MIVGLVADAFVMVGPVGPKRDVPKIALIGSRPAEVNPAMAFRYSGTSGALKLLFVEFQPNKKYLVFCTAL